MDATLFPNATGAAVSDAGMAALVSQAKLGEWIRAWCRGRGGTYHEPSSSRMTTALDALDRIGLRLLPAPSPHAVDLGVPIAREGSQRRVVQLVDVPLGVAGGGRVDARIAWISYRWQPGPQADWETRNYTVVITQLAPRVAARFAGVRLYARSHASSQHWFGGTGADRADIELESGEFHDGYRLRAVPGQDPIALRELFSPPVIVELIGALGEGRGRGGEPGSGGWAHLPMVEQEGPRLAFIVAGHVPDVDELDGACRCAARVWQIFAAEEL